MKMVKRLFIALLLLCATVATAHDFEVGGIYYNITDATNNTVAVTHQGDSYNAYSNEYTDDVVIPESVTYNGTTYSVASIGDYAFQYCSGLASVEIPNSVTSIGSSAFFGCSGLTSIVIPNSVTSIGDWAFDGCSSLKTVINFSNLTFSKGSCYADKVINAPNGFIDGDFAWYENESGMTLAGYLGSASELTLPAYYNGENYAIGSYAFSDCSGLTSIEISNGVTSIGDYAFSDCSSLASVEIPNSVTSIGDYAFANCSGLTSVEIPNSITCIGERAFYGCSGLTSVVIGNSVTSIGYGAFAYCSGLTNVVIGNSVTSIGGFAFYNCTGLTSIVIPNSVTSIGSSAFAYCSGLKTVINLSNLAFSEGSSSYGYVAYYADKVINAPNGFKDGDFAWYENESGMTLAGYLGSASELTLPAYYKGENYAIGSSAFSGCSGLTSIEISNGVTSIGDYAFSDCSGLTSIIVESGNMYYDSRDNCNAVIETATNTLLAGCQNTMIPNSITSIGNSAFFGCSGLRSIEIPNSVTSIGKEAFFGCEGLRSIEIPNSVTSIGNEAFTSCSGLISIIVESGNMYYDSRDNCNAVIETATNTLLAGCQNTMIPNSVTSIGEYAFANCSGLTSVEIPNSITCIGEGAFYGCSGLISVEIPNSITCIGEAAFYGCSGLASVEIPNSVTSIGDYAFQYCSSLTSVVIPNSVTSIGNQAFTYCFGLTSIEIPNSVTSIGDYAFYGCTSLTSVVIGNSVTSIGDYAFYGCKGLTSIEFNAENCTSMGNGSVFFGCNALSTVIFGENVKNIPDYAFYDCSGLTNVVIGKSVTGIGDNAFYDCFSLKTVINLSNLTFSEGSSSYGYVAYYADKVYDLPNGSIVGDFVFGKLNDVNTLVVYLGNATELTLPDDYNGEKYVIGADVFKEDTIITSIVIPNSVTSIGSSAFYDCSSLKTVINFSNLTFSKGSSYNGYIAYYADKVINAPNGYFDGDYIWAEINGVKTLAGYLGSAVELILPVDCKGENYAIGSSVFSGCSGLTSIEIPNSVTSIGSSAFEDCTALTSIEIPNSVTGIGHYAFYGCTGLSSVEIPNSVTSIGEEAFKRCSNIESLYISNSIESIGYEAFARCEKIKEIKIGLEKPIRASKDIFADVVYDDAILYVPIGAKYRYEKREPWNLFFDIVEMDFTGIDDVKVEDGEVKIVYDLNGCAVENPANGIYIIDGKKVFVK